MGIILHTQQTSHFNSGRLGSISVALCECEYAPWLHTCVYPRSTVHHGYSNAKLQLTSPFRGLRHRSLSYAITWHVTTSIDHNRGVPNVLLAFMLGQSSA